MYTYTPANVCRNVPLQFADKLHTVKPSTWYRHHYYQIFDYFLSTFCTVEQLVELLSRIKKVLGLVLWLLQSPEK